MICHMNGVNCSHDAAMQMGTGHAHGAGQGRKICIPEFVSPKPDLFMALICSRLVLGSPAHEAHHPSTARHGRHGAWFRSSASSPSSADGPRGRRWLWYSPASLSRRWWHGDGRIGLYAPRHVSTVSPSAAAAAAAAATVLPCASAAAAVWRHDGRRRRWRGYDGRGQQRRTSDSCSDQGHGAGQENGEDCQAKGNKRTVIHRRQHDINNMV